MKRVLAFILAVLMSLSFIGCHPPAGDSRPDLFVVATHSLLGVLGRTYEDTMVLEEDDFGRVMFAYLGNTKTSSRSHRMYNIVAVAIAQRTTRRYSYFYDGINVIFHEVGVPDGPTALEFLNEVFVKEHFSEEQLEQLKVENSWNEELNEDRFFRVRVARGDKRRHMTRASEEAFPSGRTGIPLTMDRNGNVIYFSRSHSNAGVGFSPPGFLFMFDSDGELIEGAVMELTDLWDYRDELREFKEANGWAFTYR